MANGMYTKNCDCFCVAFFGRAIIHEPWSEYRYFVCFFIMCLAPKFVWKKFRKTLDVSPGCVNGVYKLFVPCVELFGNANEYMHASHTQSGQQNTRSNHIASGLSQEVLCLIFEGPKS